MNGFERADWSAAWPEAEELPFPDDFAADEAAFAHELRAFYAVERDEPPPLYAQTLLNSNRPEITEPGFEQRVAYTVMRRLALPRAGLFDAAPAVTWLRSLGRSLADLLVAVPRTVAAASGALMALMALTVVVASPSFATGLRILLGDTGVQQVSSYPAHVQAPQHRVGPTGKVQTLAALNANTPVYWIGGSYGDFTFAGIRELDRPSWAQGSVLDLTYISTTKGRVATDMSALLNIREFQISSDDNSVLQIVQAGYATTVTVGNEQAVYVNGSWTDTLDSAHLGASAVWIPGQKSELILEYAGVIFWITGDQRYGIDEAALVGIAQHLLVAQGAQLTPHIQLTRLAGEELQAAQADPGRNEVLELIAAGHAPNAGSASFVQVTGDPSLK